MTALAPSRTAALTAHVMPRSLNEPVGLRPSSFSQTSELDELGDVRRVDERRRALAERDDGVVGRERQAVAVALDEALHDEPPYCRRAPPSAGGCAPRRGPRDTKSFAICGKRRATRGANFRRPFPSQERANRAREREDDTCAIAGWRRSRREDAHRASGAGDRHRLAGHGGGGARRDRDDRGTAQRGRRGHDVRGRVRRRRHVAAGRRGLRLGSHPFGHAHPLRRDRLADPGDRLLSGRPDCSGRSASPAATRPTRPASTSSARGSRTSSATSPGPPSAATVTVRPPRAAARGGRARARVARRTVRRDRRLRSRGVALPHGLVSAGRAARSGSAPSARSSAAAGRRRRQRRGGRPRVGDPHRPPRASRARTRLRVPRRVAARKRSGGAGASRRRRSPSSPPFRACGSVGGRRADQRSARAACRASPRGASRDAGAAAPRAAAARRVPLLRALGPRDMHGRARAGAVPLRAPATIRPAVGPLAGTLQPMASRYPRVQVPVDSEVAAAIERGRRVLGGRTPASQVLRSLALRGADAIESDADAEAATRASSSSALRGGPPGSISTACAPSGNAHGADVERRPMGRRHVGVGSRLRARGCRVVGGRGERRRSRRLSCGHARTAVRRSRRGRGRECRSSARSATPGTGDPRGHRRGDRWNP